MAQDLIVNKRIRGAAGLARLLDLRRQSAVFKGEAVRLATTANITLSGEQTIDSVAAVVGDRVLVKDQSTGANNGIYRVQHGTWLRTSDADHSDKLTAGTKVVVQEGTTNAGTTWRLQTTNVVLGTTAQTWTSDGGSGGTLAGDVTGAIGSNTISARSVTYAKMQAVSATARLLGRTSSGAGDVEELTAATVKTFLALLAADISDFNTAVRLNRLDQMAAAGATVQMGGFRLANLSAPSFDADAARWLDTKKSDRITVAGTTYTFVIGDAGRTVESNSGSSTTFTVPPASSVAWTTGEWIECVQGNTGALTIAAGAGVTINAAGGVLTLPQRWSRATLHYRGSDSWQMDIVADPSATYQTIANLDADGTLAANSATKYPAQSATKTYADTKIPKSTITQAGGLILGTGSATVTELAPTATIGLVPVRDDATNKVTWAGYHHAHSAFLAPSGALAETVARSDASLANSGALTSQTLRLTAISLPKGLVITSITFVSGTTALSAGTNQWFGLFDSSRAGLRLTSDDTSTAWGSNTAKTLNLTSTFTTTYAGLHYLACMVKATTAPSLLVSASSSAVQSLSPALCGNTSDTALSTPVGLPFTAGAITASGAMAYAYVS